MKLRILLIAIAGFLIAPLTFGHHSPSRYDLGNEISIQGEVVRLAWGNPHVYIYLNSRDADGQLVEWQIEGSSTPIMGRAGWSRSILSAGDPVTALFNPARNLDSHNGLLVSLTTENDLTLGVKPERIRPKVAAGSIAGLWNANAGYDNAIVQFGTVPRKLTPRALAIQPDISIADDKGKNCIEMSTPLVTVFNYINEIEILDDRVLIKTEYFSVDRTIYTDGRGHPENGETSTQGHSIGHWDGDNLLVDTTLFDGDMFSSVRGIQSVDLHVQEKYILSDDKTRLLIELTVDDPALLHEPYTITTVWDYAPDSIPDRWQCDPETAVLFDF